MSLQQLSVFIENRPGSIADFARLLRDNGIDMRALSLADAQDYGVLRIIVDDVYKTTTVLKSASYVFKITPVIAFPLKDYSGSLSHALDLLGDKNINIEYLYAFVGPAHNMAYVIFRIADTDMENAAQILKNAGYTPMDQEDL